MYTLGLNGRLARKKGQPKKKSPFLKTKKMAVLKKKENGRKNGHSKKKQKTKIGQAKKISKKNGQGCNDY